MKVLIGEELSTSLEILIISPQSRGIAFKITL